MVDENIIGKLKQFGDNVGRQWNRISKNREDGQNTKDSIQSPPSDPPLPSPKIGDDTTYSYEDFQTESWSEWAYSGMAQIYGAGESVVTWIVNSFKGRTLSPEEIRHRKQQALINQLESNKSARKAAINKQFNDDIVFLKEKEERCKNWKKETQRVLDLKKDAVTNQYFAVDSDYVHSKEWEIESTNRKKLANDLCEKLECVSAQPKTLDSLVIPKNFGETPGTCSAQTIGLKPLSTSQISSVLSFQQEQARFSEQQNVIRLEERVTFAEQEYQECVEAFHQKTLNEIRLMGLLENAKDTNPRIRPNEIMNSRVVDVSIQTDQLDLSPSSKADSPNTNIGENEVVGELFQVWRGLPYRILSGEVLGYVYIRNHHAHNTRVFALRFAFSLIVGVVLYWAIWTILKQVYTSFRNSLFELEVAAKRRKKIRQQMEIEEQISEAKSISRGSRIVRQIKKVGRRDPAKGFFIDGMEEDLENLAPDKNDHEKYAKWLEDEEAALKERATIRGKETAGKFYSDFFSWWLNPVGRTIGRVLGFNRGGASASCRAGGDLIDVSFQSEQVKIQKKWLTRPKFKVLQRLRPDLPMPQIFAIIVAIWILLNGYTGSNIRPPKVERPDISRNLNKLSMVELEQAINGAFEEGLKFEEELFLKNQTPKLEQTKIKLKKRKRRENKHNQKTYTLQNTDRLRHTSVEETEDHIDAVDYSIKVTTDRIRI